MRRVTLAVSLFAAGCTGSQPTTPSTSASVSSSDSTAASSNTTQGPVNTASAPAVGDTTAASPQFGLSGPQSPSNCFSAQSNPMQWLLNVSDAGPSPLRFIALAHQDDSPGCGATVSNPRSRIVIGGTADYAVHSSGQTTFTFDQRMYSCGRVQVDVSAFDAAGHETLLVGTVINYGTACAPPLSCRQREVSSPPGVPATLVATGGTGEYHWSAPGAVPSDGTGGLLSTNYWRQGVYTATVTSGNQIASCDVVALPLANCNRCITSLCQPYYQLVGVNRTVTFNARVPAGASFGWTAPGGAPSSGSGVGNLDGTRTSFQSVFATPGFYEVDLQGVTPDPVLGTVPFTSCTVSAVPPEFAP